MPFSRSATRRWTALTLALCGLACVTLPAPRGFLPTRATLGQGTRGAWAHVVLKPIGSQPALVMDGELIEAGATWARVLTDQGLVVLQEWQIQTLTLQVFSPELNGATIHMVLGSVSTLSHGGFLAFTLPLWIGAGLGAKEEERASALLRYPTAPWSELRPFARFPQGYPEELPATELGTLVLHAEERLSGQPAPAKVPSPAP